MKYQKIAVVGKETGQIKRILERKGFKVAKNNPDLVLSFGGDGTLLLAERLYPGVPKLGVKKSAYCAKCHPRTVVPGRTQRLDLKHLSEELDELDEHSLKKELKLEASAKGRKLFALNEIRLHSKNVLGALRFKVEVNGKAWADYAVGDGVIIATPFGSTGYFHSVSRKKFSEGIGIALNNPVKSVKPLVLENANEAKIKVTVLRNDALLIADNNPATIVLRKGESVLVKKAGQDALIIT